jgi:hypothetical protein
MKKSTDSGVNWSTVTAAGTHYWTSLETSDDGQRIIAAWYESGVNVSHIIGSFDGGATWTSLYDTTDYQYFSNIRGNYNLRKVAWGQKQLFSGDLVEAKLTFMV